MTSEQPKPSIAHFGPDSRFVGGIGSVLVMMNDYQIGGSVLLFPTWWPGFRSVPVFARALVSCARLDPATIVHVHMAKGGSIIRKSILLALARGRRHRRILTIHTSTLPAEVRDHPRRFRRALELADVVICLTDEAKRLARSLGVRTPLVVIPNPMIVDQAAPPASSTGPLVLFAGEVGTRKGVDVLEEAWRIVLAQCPEASCVVLGPVADFVPAPDSGLELRGVASRNEMREWLRRARVITLPSRAEAMPMILLEAMATGRPFVATDVGQIRELAKTAGVLVPVDDSTALAEELVGMLTAPDRAEALGSAGQAEIARRFSPETIDHALRAVYAR